jgi:hypothetical protein
MSESEAIGGAIEEAGGIGAVAKARGLSDEAVRLWRVRGAVPADHVLWLAERTGWKYSPHRLSRSLYPHPDDGLPEQMRGARVLAAGA